MILPTEVRLKLVNASSNKSIIAGRNGLTIFHLLTISMNLMIQSSLVSKTHSWTIIKLSWESFRMQAKMEVLKISQLTTTSKRRSSRDSTLPMQDTSDICMKISGTQMMINSITTFMNSGEIKALTILEWIASARETTQVRSSLTCLCNLKRVGLWKR